MEFDQRQFTSNPVFVTPALDAALSVTADRPEGTMVDIGCADGYVLARFASQRPGWNCIGVDVSAPNVALTAHAVSSAGLANASASLIDVTTTDVPATDLIVANSVFHLVPDARASLERVLRRVRPAGNVVMSLPDRRAMNSLVIGSRRVLIGLGLRRLLLRERSSGSESDWRERVAYLTVLPALFADDALEIFHAQGFAIDSRSALAQTHPVQPGHSLIVATRQTP